MTALEIQPLKPDFAARVTGLDLRRPPSPALVQAVEEAIFRYGVLVFPDQDVSDEEQLAFSRAFGPIEDKRGGHIAKPAEERLSPAMNDISNLGKEGALLPRESRTRLFNLGNRLWHSDSSFRAVPAKYSLLSARAIPSDGSGNTEFADMRAAYDALGAAEKSEAEDLVCEHSLLFSRGALGFEPTEEEIRTFRPVRQRLVRTHPGSGRKSLYLSSHAGTVLDWPVPEARVFLRDLIEHATQAAFVYSHAWRPFDLVMWDNRCTMHRVRRYSDAEVRDMRRTTVAGEEMTVSQGDGEQEA